MSHQLLDVDVGISDRCCFRLARSLHTGLTPSPFGYAFPGKRFGSSLPNDCASDLELAMGLEPATC